MMNLVLYSERLTLTPITASDVDLALVMFTDPDVMKYVGGVITPDKVRSEMPKWIKRGSNGCIGIWCISNRRNGEKVGSVALLPIPIEEDDTDFDLVVPGQMPDVDIEIGYFLKRSAWRNGYATEACQRLLQMVFEESSLTEIVATFDTDNVASREVLKKTGFIDRGMMRCYGEEGPHYRITYNEWVRLKQST